MKPMDPGTDRYCPEMNNATMPPINDNGTLTMIRAAWPTEPNAKYSSRKIIASDTGTTIIRRCWARCWFSNWPPKTTE